MTPNPAFITYLSKIKEKQTISVSKISKNAFNIKQQDYFLKKIIPTCLLFLLGFIHVRHRRKAHGFAKGHESHCERLPFTLRKAIFYNAKEGLLQYTGYQVVTKQASNACKKGARRLHSSPTPAIYTAKVCLQIYQ